MEADNTTVLVVDFAKLGDVRHPPGVELTVSSHFHSDDVSTGLAGEEGNYKMAR